MYRIEKAVSRILKVTEPEIFIPARNETIARYGLTYSEVRDWARDVWMEFITDPIIDEIAARYGATAEEVLSYLKDLKIYVGDQDRTSGSGGGKERGGLTLRIAIKEIAEDYKTGALGTLAHELTHVADARIGTHMGGWPGSFIKWLMSEHEQEAIAMNMLDLHRFGYTKTQILESLMDKYRNDLVGADPKEARDILGLIYDNLLREMKEEYVEA